MPSKLDPATLRAVKVELTDLAREMGLGVWARRLLAIADRLNPWLAESPSDPGDYRQCPTCSGWVLRTEPHSCEVGPEMPEPGLGQCQSCGEREGHGDWCPVLEERERLIAVVENLAHEYDSPESEDALRDVLAALKAAQTQEPA